MNLQQKLQNSEANRQLLQQLESLAVQRFASGGANGNAILGEREKPQNSGQTASSSSGMAGMNMGTSASTNPASPQPTSSSGMKMSGGASSAMSEVLRIQLEIMDLENSIISLQSEIAAEKARFNLLLNRATDLEIQIPNELILNDLLLEETATIALIQAQNPMLGMLNHEVLANEAQAEMARKMAYPMFGIGLQYMLIGKKTEQISTGHGAPAMNEMNGMDMIMPMVSLSIPLYRNKYKAAQRESSLLKQANEEKRNNTFNRLQADFIRLKHELNGEQRKIELFKKQQDLAQTAYELVLQEFASGKSDLSAVIQVQRQLLDYQFNRAEAIADYNTKIAKIQKLISQ